MNITNKRIAIIYNPMSGMASRSSRTQLSLYLQKHVQTAEVVWFATTAEAGSASKLAQVAVDMASDLVIVSGGDGTVCQVAQTLIGTGLPIAVLPGGTGNLFARTFNSAQTAEKFMQMVLHGQPQPVDVVRAEYTDTSGKEHKAIFMVGFGLGKVSDAISLASPVFKRLFGRLVYVVRVSFACLFPQAQRFHLSTPAGEIAEDTAALFVMNVTPPAMSTLSRGCSPSDGLMDVVIFRAENAFQFMDVTTCLAFGRPDSSKHYRRFRTKEVTIRSEVEMLPNIDGDAGAPTNEIKLAVEPAAIQMILSE